MVSSNAPAMRATRNGAGISSKIVSAGPPRARDATKLSTTGTRRAKKCPRPISSASASSRSFAASASRASTSGSVMYEASVKMPGGALLRSTK